jgi:16S rRNA (cytosine967-C5)-methyltransferase
MGGVLVRVLVVIYARKPLEQGKDGMAATGLEARRAALEMLHAVLWDKGMLAQVAPHDDLSPSDAARAGRLAADVLRHMGRLDAVLRPYVARQPRMNVHNILRLGAAELLVAGGDAHGVVNAAVAIAKRHPGTAKASGMINAVLRRVAEDGAEAWANTAPQHLPVWLRKPLHKTYGTEVLAAIEAAHEHGAPLDLTAKPGFAIDGATVLPTGTLRLPKGQQVSALPGYDTGDWWVQDAAAALPVKLLGDVAGARVLDMCAAPGGKTMQLASMGAKVTALDLSRGRLARVEENLARTDLQAELVCEDALTYTAAPFDAILLDAPCSATGTIRRHPDLPFVKSTDEVEALTKLQMQMIEAALSLLAPGGRLVFCTCSLLPVEGEFQVKAALKRHDGLRILPVDPEPLGGDATWASPEGGLRLRPDFWADRGGMDGFYMACLQKP